MALKTDIKDLEKKIKDSSEMTQSGDLVNMKRVMRRLEMVNKNDVPRLKGKVAASLSACDEILTTELLFSGFFQEMEPNLIAAVLSCLIYSDNKSEGKPLQDPIL